MYYATERIYNILVKTHKVTRMAKEIIGGMWFEAPQHFANVVDRL